jgi:hypothetical protein
MSKPGALSIRTKLIGVFSLFVAALVGLGLFDLHGIRTIHGLMGEVQQNWMPGVRWATALKTGVGDARAAAFQHVLATDESGMNDAEKRYAAGLAAVAAARPRSSSGSRRPRSGPSTSSSARTGRHTATLSRRSSAIRATMRRTPQRSTTTRGRHPSRQRRFKPRTTSSRSRPAVPTPRTCGPTPP